MKILILYKLRADASSAPSQAVITFLLPAEVALIAKDFLRICPSLYNIPRQSVADLIVLVNYVRTYESTTVNINIDT